MRAAIRTWRFISDPPSISHCPCSTTACVRLQSTSLTLVPAGLLLSHFLTPVSHSCCAAFSTLVKIYSYRDTTSWCPLSWLWPAVCSFRYKLETYTGHLLDSDNPLQIYWHINPIQFSLIQTHGFTLLASGIHSGQTQQVHQKGSHFYVSLRYL